MGDTDGSSNAAQSALKLEKEDHNESQQDDTADDERPGFFRRVLDAFSPSDTDDALINGALQSTLATPHGMINLRRLRVEDVTLVRPEVVTTLG